MKLLIGLLLVGLAVEGRAQLTCFVCDNCGDPFDRTGQTALACPQPVPTIVTPPNEGTTATPPAPTPPIPGGPDLTPPPVITTIGPAPAPGQTTTPGPAPGPGESPELTPPPLPGRRKRQAVNPISHRCFILTHNGVTRRGCTSHGNDFLETCRNLNGGQEPNNCRLCDWAECNSASGITVSAMTILAAAFLALRLY